MQGGRIVNGGVPYPETGNFLALNQFNSWGAPNALVSVHHRFFLHHVRHSSIMTYMRLIFSVLLALPVSLMAQQWSYVDRLKSGETVELENATFGYSRDTGYNGTPTYGGANFRVSTSDGDQLLFSFVIERMDCTVGFGNIQIQLQTGTSWERQKTEFWRAERADVYDIAAKKICALDAQYQKNLPSAKR